MNPLGPIRHTAIGVPTTTYHQVDARTAHYPALLTPDERTAIVRRCQNIGGDRVTGRNAKGGSATAHPIHNPDAIFGADITRRIWHTIAHANQVTLGWQIPIDLARAGVTCYEPGDSMGAHVDDEERDQPPWDLPHRGLSMSLPLTSGHHGGRLRLRTADGEWTTPTIQPGDALVFGSSLVHEVLPVTTGRRWVLLFWAYCNHNLRPIR